MVENTTFFFNNCKIREVHFAFVEKRFIINVEILRKNI